MATPDRCRWRLHGPPAGACIVGAIGSTYVSPNGVRPHRARGVVQAGVASRGEERYQHERPTLDQLHRWFDRPDQPRAGLGVAAGAVSGGIQLTGIEGRAVTAGALERLRSPVPTERTVAQTRQFLVSPLPRVLCPADRRSVSSTGRVSTPRRRSATPGSCSRPVSAAGTASAGT
jgi:hypothetical protein